jgi:hypothetical protein
MANQSTTKPLGIIINLKIHIHGIPYIDIYTMLKTSVVDSNYSMLLGRPWLKVAKVTNDWVNNVINVQGNEIIRTRSINRKLGVETKSPPSICLLRFIGRANR